MDETSQLALDSSRRTSPTTGDRHRLITIPVLHTMPKSDRIAQGFTNIRIIIDNQNTGLAS